MTCNYRMNHPSSFASCSQVLSQRPLPTARGFLQTICEHPIYHEKMRHIQAGAHSAEVEGDLVLLRLVGDLNEAEAVQVMAAAAAVQDIYGYHLGLSDLRSFGRVLPDARRYIGEWTKRHSLGVNASFGGSVVAFAIATLIHRAASMIRGQESSFGFFKTEAEARAWLDAQRPRVQAQVPAPKVTTKSP